MKNKVCTYLNVNTANSRLWLKPKGGEWQQLSPENSEQIQESLADADVETGDFIMIETKRTDVDPWPRDLIDKQNENFRDFEINSRVDAKDNGGKWYSGTVVDIMTSARRCNCRSKDFFDRFNLMTNGTM